MFADPNEEEGCNCNSNGCGNGSENKQPEETRSEIYNVGRMLNSLVEQKIRLLQLRHTIYVVLRGKKVFCKVNKPTSAETLLVAFTPDYVRQFVRGVDSFNPSAMIEDACDKISLILAEMTMNGVSLMDFTIAEGVGIEGEEKLKKG
jgi:hypothetical protein